MLRFLAGGIGAVLVRASGAVPGGAVLAQRPRHLAFSCSQISCSSKGRGGGKGGAGKGGGGKRGKGRGGGSDAKRGSKGGSRSAGVRARRRSPSPPPLRIALVGRPNVGKSTLLNRLAGRRRAIAHSTPGLTRDEREWPGQLGDSSLVVWDTPGIVEDIAESDVSRRKGFSSTQGGRRAATPAGFEAVNIGDLVSGSESGVAGSPRSAARALAFAGASGDLSASMRPRADPDRELSPRRGADPVSTAMAAASSRAMRRSHAAVMMFDAREGVTDGDIAVARWVRTVAAGKPIVLVANKCENALLHGRDIQTARDGDGPDAGPRDPGLDSAAGDSGTDAGGHAASSPAAEIAATARRLGFGEPVFLSAQHGAGMQDLYLALKPLEMAVRLADGHDPVDPALFGRQRGDKDKKKNKKNKDKSDTATATGGKDEETFGSIDVVDVDAGGRGAARDGDGEGEGQGEGQGEDGEGDLVDLDADTRPVRVAIIGRPNAGKSTLLNRLVGEERVVVGPEPGVTRDAVRVAWTHEGRDVMLVDTAGIERMRVATARTDADPVECEARRDTFRAVVTGDVAVVVIDHERMSKGEDLQQIHRVIEEGRGIVLALNKWDLVRDRAERRSMMAQVTDQVSRILSGLGEVECVHISAVNGRGVAALMPAVMRVHERLHSRIATRKLNRWLEAAMRVQEPPRVHGTKLKIRFATQALTRPPTFVLFLNTRKERLPGSYVQYLVGSLRREFDLHSVPVRIVQRNVEDARSGAPARRVSKMMG